MPVKNRSPEQILRWAIGEMAQYQICVMSTSPFYCTNPVGQEGQSDYVNAVVRVRATMKPVNLLKNLKRIEKTAGRGVQPAPLCARWGPRPLDLDLVDYKAMVTRNFQICSRDSEVTKASKRPRVSRCELVLPHPQVHMRPFVIRPIIDIAPFWHHPVTGLSALSMWALIKNKPEGSILRKLA